MRAGDGPSSQTRSEPVPDQPAGWVELIEPDQNDAFRLHNVDALRAPVGVWTEGS